MAKENKETTETTATAQTNEQAQPAEQTAPAAEEQKPAAELYQEQKPAEQKEDLGSNKNPSEKSDEDKNPSTPEVVNEKTEFTLPDGLKVDEKRMTSFKTLAQELKLTKEQAQKLVDMDSKNIQAADEAFKKMQADWKAETMKQLGENAEQKLGEAAAAFKKFGDDEFVKLMKDTGLENHPAVVRVFRNLGSKISTDTTIPATSGGVNSAMTLSEALYGKN